MIQSFGDYYLAEKTPGAPEEEDVEITRQDRDEIGLSFGQPAQATFAFDKNEESKAADDGFE